MKKILAIILCFALVLTLSACTKVPSNGEGEQTTKNEGMNGVPNPMAELTEEEFENIFYAYYLPDGAEDSHFFKIASISEDTLEIAQINFIRFDHEYCFRYAKGPEQDIAGMYYEWSYDKENDKLNDDSKYGCHIQINEDEGAGVASWYDENNKTNYCISMSEGATRELLLSTFENYYRFYCEAYSVEEN